MLHFAVPNCEIRGCLNWRVGNNCAKHQTPIPLNTPIPMTMQSVDICKVHEQLNNTKLRNLLEET